MVGLWRPMTRSSCFHHPMRPHPTTQLAVTEQPGRITEKLQGWAGQPRLTIRAADPRSALAYPGEPVHALIDRDHRLEIGRLGHEKAVAAYPGQVLAIG